MGIAIFAEVVARSPVLMSSTWLVTLITNSLAMKKSAPRMDSVMSAIWNFRVKKQPCLRGEKCFFHDFLIKEPLEFTRR